VCRDPSIVFGLQNLHQIPLRLVATYKISKKNSLVRFTPRRLLIDRTRAMILLASQLRWPPA
jgi:hypothetical protein